MTIIETIYQALCACFGFSPSSEEAAALFCEAYLEGESIPQLPRNKDIIFYWEEPAPGALVVPQEYANMFPKFSMYNFPEHLLHVTCYGPNAVENAKKIRALLFLDGANCPRRILRQEGIYPVPEPDGPVQSFEQEGSLWRKRADLTVSLRVREELQGHSRNAIVTAPAVIFNKS